MDLKDIKAIIDLMKKNALSEFELEKQDFKIKLKRGFNGGGGGVSYEDMPVQAYLPPAGGSAPAPASPSAAPAISAGSSDLDIKSPMIGTFYLKPSPDKPAFKSVGDTVKAGETVCIIEAMKLFNEIESEVTGKIVKIVANDMTPVEYGQTLFLVEPA